MRGPGYLLPLGPIHLKLGKHIGPNRGFGAAHIWHEHQTEMSQVGLMNFDDVPVFVARIVKPGSQVFFEFARLRGNTRVSVVRSVNGTAILELIETRDHPHYSVVTAFKDAKAHGTKIGIVR